MALKWRLWLVSPAWLRVIESVSEFDEKIYYLSADYAAGPIEARGYFHGITDVDENATAGNGGDTDGDGIPDRIDLDSDNDIDGDDITEWLSLTGTENSYGSPMLRGDTDNVGASSPTSRTVDITDFQNFLGGFTGAGSTWEVGNFNGDNVVDITDFSNHFLPSFAATGGGSYDPGRVSLRHNGNSRNGQRPGHRSGRPTGAGTRHRRYCRKGLAYP